MLIGIGDTAACAELCAEGDIVRAGAGACEGIGDSVCASDAAACAGACASAGAAAGDGGRMAVDVGA